MLLWIILFLAVIIVSFILAYRSVRDFYESPLDFKSNYSLFLIRHPEALSHNILTHLHRQVISEGLIFSLENLFKGQRRALTIYGPVAFLKPLEKVLNLLELEDYAQKIIFAETKAWEIGVKKNKQNGEISESGLELQVGLQEAEQFWRQMVLRPVNKGTGDEVLFQVAIRAIVTSHSEERLKNLSEELLKMGGSEGLAPLPQAYSTAQIIEFYQKRSLQVSLPKLGKDRSAFYFSADQILKLC